MYPRKLETNPIDKKLVETIKDIGYCHWEEEYDNGYGSEIKLSIYEYDNKTYLIREVNNECIMLRDITVRNE